ncbi:MAG TPA: sugar phosphate isomerase/epimerase [Thermomicrobiales bacterium]|nr:sugar phosphate isomerase/epimerase [Thermomicrobiales bacterium]
MSTSARLAVQTALLPGRDLAEQFQNAAEWGFDAVEVAVGPSFDLGERLDDVRQASASSGLPVAAICTHSIHDPIQPDAEERARRLAALATLLAQADELGATGVVSVPLRPARGFPSLAEQEAEFARLADLTVASFGEWVATLPAGNAAVFLEPLCRFEASFLNTVGQAAELSRRIGSPRVLALADFFHMNIEERDFVAPLVEAGSSLGHVHIADNNRLQPGAGMIPFGPSFAALRQMGYGGYISIECYSPAGARIEGDPAVAFPETVRFMRDLWTSAGAAADQG